MELIVAITLLVILALIAPRYGYDSREALHSREGCGLDRSIGLLTDRISC